MPRGWFHMIFMPRSRKINKIMSFYVKCHSQSGSGTRNAKKPLRGFQGRDKNGLHESFKMSPHLICLNWNLNFHNTSRPDPEAGHKRDLRCQPRPIKWGLISQLSFRAFSWHPWKQSRGFFILPWSTAVVIYHGFNLSEGKGLGPYIQSGQIQGRQQLTSPTLTELGYFCGKSETYGFFCISSSPAGLWPGRKKKLRKSWPGFFFCLVSLKNPDKCERTINWKIPPR